MNGMMNKIETRDVNFWYGDFHALKGIQHGYLGEVGCGFHRTFRLR